MKVPTSSTFALLLTCTIFLCAYSYGRFHFYRDPGSIFFDPNRALERTYSLHRESEAKRFLHAVFSTNASSSERFWSAGKNATVCGVFITVGREYMMAEHPLELAVTSALAGLTKVEREDFDLRVYFANTKPADHPLYNSSLLELVDHFGSAQDVTNPAQFHELARLEKERQLGRKIGLDFSYALHYAYSSSSSPYIAIFEGHVIFADSWFARSRTALQEIDDRTGSARERWLDMRLFNEERSIGWASGHILGNNVPFIILGLSAGTFSILVPIRHYTKFGRRVFTKGFLAVICGISIPVFVIFFFQAGKSSVVPHFPGVKQQQWGCCTQGIIMPREQAPGLAVELVRRASTPPDIIIEDFAKSRHFLRFALDPVQIQHLGYTSQLDPKRELQKMAWSMAFEQLRADKLRKDHKKMVSELYGFDFDSK